VPFDMVDEALAETRAAQSRVRDLPSRVVVHLLLAASLFPELGYPGVWRKLTASLACIGPATPTAGALYQARRRVGAAPLKWLFDLTRHPDGSYLSMLGSTKVRVIDAEITITTSAGRHTGVYRLGCCDTDALVGCARAGCRVARTCPSAAAPFEDGP
jgi:hypothetical protein